MSDTSQAVAALSGGAAVLRKGMTKQDLVAAFGVPQDVAHHSTFDGKDNDSAFLMHDFNSGRDGEWRNAEFCQSDQAGN